MNIDFTRLDHLNARLTLVINHQDYAPVLEDNLKKYSKKLAIKGFRSGKTPKSVMNKMYGKGILEETVSKMLNDKLFGYLDEQKIEYFGAPMMADDSEPVDFNPKSPSDYTFVFDIGLKPSFALDYSLQDPIKIKIPGTNEKALDEDIIRYRRIFGTDEVIEGGQIESTDKVGVSLQRLDENGQEAGEATETTIDLDRIQGEANDKLPGQKAGATFEAELDKFLGYTRAVVIKNTLGLEEDPNPDQPLNYRITVTSIHRPQKTELTGEQLTRFVGRSMENETEFRQMLEDRDANNNQAKALDMKKMAIRLRLLQANPFDVPEAFLLKWVNHQRDKKVEPGTREANNFIRDAKWSLLLNKISAEKQLEVTEKDIQKQVTNWVIENVNYTQTDIKKLMNQLYSNEYFMSNMKENAMEAVVFSELIPLYSFDATLVDVEGFEKAFHDIHHELFDHGDHGDHDHGHHHHHHHEHSHESHEHSHR